VQKFLARAERKKGERRDYWHRVVHLPLLQATVTFLMSQVEPSSARVAWAAQPQAAQVASQAASAVVKAAR
jgi:hypothetical protein